MQIVHNMGAMPSPLRGFPTFLAIEHSGTISAASEALHLSQPAVTRRLQALEQSIGGPLFERTSTGLRLTSVGTTLLPFAQRACAAERDGIAAVAQELDGPSGTVSFGIVGSLAAQWGASILAAMVAEYPDIEIALSTGSSAEVRDSVRRGDVSVGVSYGRPDDPTLVTHELFVEDLLLCSHPGHRLAGADLDSFAPLATERWLVYPDNPADHESTGATTRSLLQAHHVSKDRLFPIDSLTAQVALTEAGYGIAFLPLHVAREYIDSRRLSAINVPTVSAAVNLSTRQDAYLRPAEHALIDLLLALRPTETGP